MRVRDHVHRQLVPLPGGQAELAALRGEIAARLLDRSLPLWEMHVIEGLADGTVALFAKFHHAVVDGVAAANLVAHLCDLSPGGRTDNVRVGRDAMVTGALRNWLSCRGELPGRPLVATVPVSIPDMRSLVGG